MALNGRMSHDALLGVNTPYVRQLLLVHSEKKKEDLLRRRYPWSEIYADRSDDIHNSNDSGPEEERSEDSVENISRVNEQPPEQKEHTSIVEGEEKADTPDFLGVQEMDQYMYLTMPDKEKQIRNQKQMEKKKTPRYLWSVHNTNLKTCPDLEGTGAGSLMGDTEMTNDSATSLGLNSSEERASSSDGGSRPDSKKSSSSLYFPEPTGKRS